MTRRGWVAMLTALGLLVAALLAWLFATRPPVPSGNAGARSVLAVARAAASAPRSEPAGASASMSVPASGHGDDEVELCGGRWVKLNPDGTADNDALERAIDLPDARARLLASLRADPSDYAHAVAWRLSMADASQATESLGALAHMATTTQDPRVYALALKACGRGTTAAQGDCQLLSVPQWARLDPGNGAPWTAVLADAVTHHDVAGQNEALYHIAHSDRYDDRFLALTEQVLAHTPTDDGALAATLALTVDASAIDAAQLTSPPLDLTRMCRGAALADANRRQTCADAAELLFSKADTLVARQTGAGMGQQLGWPPERIEQSRGESTAFIQSTLVRTSAGPRDACTDMRQDLGAFQTRARLGEAGAVRDWVAHAGSRPEDFIRLERDAQAQRAAEAAASGASASN